MFDILFNNIRALSIHTELLESCDWDEQECNDVIEIATAVFNSALLRTYAIRIWFLPSPGVE